MIKNYSTLKKISNFKKAFYLLFIFFVFSQIANAQCASPPVGCPNTDLSNFGTESNNNAATIEYDNFVSSFHTTIVRTSDGSLQTWGEDIGNDGLQDVLSPLTINATNFPALTGTPLKAGLGSVSANNVQGILLATDGLYAWSKEGIVLDGSITSSTTFQKITINGNTNGLPTGVTPGDVKMMFATYRTLAITTCSGDVWVISQTASVRGNGGTGNATTWYRVTTSDAGNPFLTDVVACRGNYDGLMALKSDGTVYVWGVNVLLGDNTAVIASQTRARQMAIPAITPKMISSSGSGTERSYYILATNGNLYTVGENSNRQLGDWTTTDRLGWVQPRYTSAAGPVMSDIVWFSVQEHDNLYGSANVINTAENLYAFGQNNNSLLGTPSDPSNPTMPTGVSLTDKILAVETGGHTTMIVKSCDANFGYVGHRIRGSMGNGSNTTSTEASYNFATAAVQICGVESIPVIQPISAGGGPGSNYCVGDPVLLEPTPAGGTLSILSGPGTLTGNTVNFTAAGTVVVQYSVTTACGGTSVTSRNFEAVLCPLDLQVTKAVNNTNPSVGDNVTFTITTTNNGPYKATGITVNDVLSSGYTFVSATPSVGTWTAPNWTVGSLTNGTSATLSIVATVNPTGSYVNTATVTGNDPDTTAANNTATVTPLVETNLAVTKTAPNVTTNVGSNVTFTITASNAGPSAATGVTVNDVLPAGYTFVSATPSTGTWSAPNWTIGNLANGANATLTIVATVNATGPYSNTATITGAQNDPTPGNNSGSATPAVNRFPVANDDDQSAFPLTEDGADGTVNILTNDTDPDGNPSAPVNGIGQFTIDLDTALAGIQTTYSDAKGVWTLNTTTGIVTFNPANNYNGTATITYTLCDVSGLCDNADITFVVTAVNDAPVANNNAVSTDEDTPVTINITTNDTDLDGTIDVATVDLDPATAGIQTTFTVTGQGTYTVDNTGLVTFTPVLNYNGTATPINYTVNDNLGLVSNIATLTITVNAVNDAPVANNNAVSTDEDTPVTINVTTNDTDLDGTIDVATVDLDPATAGIQTTFTVTGQGTYTVDNTGLVTFTPVLNYNGTATPINYTVNDNLGLVSNIATLTITVTAVNDAPVANNNAVSTDEDTPVTINVTTNDTDLDGTIDVATVDLDPATAGIQTTFTVTGQGTYTVDNTGVVTFTPVLNYNGTTTPINYTVNDNLGLVSNIATLTVTVTAVNDAPVANNNAVSTDEDTPVTINITTNDTDLDGTIDVATVDLDPATAGIQTTFTVTGQGTYTVDNTGLVTFTPVLNYNGIATPINYTVNDNLGLVSNIATLTVTVNAVNDAPVANNNAVSTDEDTPVTINVTTNDTDLDGTIDVATVDLDPATAGIQTTFTVTGQGTYTVDNTGLVTFTPVLNYNGTATPINYTVNDNLGLVSNIATLTVTVNAVNDAPVANNNAVSTDEDTPVTINITTNDTDLDGTIDVATVDLDPATAGIQTTFTVTGQGTYTVDNTGLVTFTPVLNYNGTATPINYTVNDNLGLVSNIATLTITVNAVNDAPVTLDDINSVIPSVAGATAINALLATDLDGSIANYTVLTLPSQGVLALAGIPVTLNQVLTPLEASMLTYEPSGTFTGNDTFTFTATDDLGALALSSATITIPVGNNAPVAQDDINASIPSRSGATVINDLIATDTDGTIANYTILTLPSHGVLALSGIPVVANQVLTPLEVTMLTYDPSGAYSGNDTFTFTATDNLGAIDASPATITLVIEKTLLDAVDDPVNSVVGINSTVTVVNVFTNDTLNNNPLLPSDVNLSVVTPDPSGVLSLRPDGTVELIPNAPPGNYSLTYEICETVNPTNCDPATVSVSVVAPTITVTANSYCSNNTPYVAYSVVADNFTPTDLLTINWIDSANNIVATQNNMPLSGNVLWPGATVDGNGNPTDWPGWLLVNGQWTQGNDGFQLTRPSVTMQFTLNPTQSVVVNYPSAVSGCNAMPTFGIEAGNDDDVVLADGINGSLEVINVLDNDKLNGVPVNASDVIVSGTNLPTGITLNPDGTIDVAPGTAAGSHILTYQICEVANPNNCSTATVTIFVEVPAIAIVKTVVLNDNNGNGYAEAGETLTYSFSITNNGNVALQNIVVTDPLPGIVMSGGPINLAVGQTDNTSITGIYTLSQADVNSGSISNQATVSGTTPSGINVTDKSDFSDLQGENPTIIELSGCVIKIFNAVSANGDDKNGRFYVQGLECYPDNTVEIYNRWGVLVFEREHYNNNDIAFRGISEGRVTIKDSNGLPEGTYYYIVKYKDNQSNTHQKAGYLYLTK
ncbi:Ig-like domain-containing protein [Flavobacterium geliluteum]|uniref:Tandem-95 repeat protein n=1 Tax=Flavobacterium geliluteum TaxID=2816120 RepID=A0A941B3J0_9FLAO|nr:Ig-like domain-containing protein [Flavobacterium geliluteum]MBP4138553.1 tandem-95 repeat protein [Flavobacterium geliluteum]